MTTKKTQSLYTKFAERFMFADEENLLTTLKATAFKVKDGTVTDEQMTALLIVADQYGLNPFTKELYAYPDKQNGIVPVVSVDGWSRIINQHPDMDGLEFVYDDNWVSDMQGAKPCPASIECVIYRKGRAHPVRVKEFLDEVFRAPFKGFNKTTNQEYVLDGPWQSHTKRMLRHKALIQCSRIAFGFVGIFDEDEAQRIIEGQVVNQQTGEVEPSEMAKTYLTKLVKRCQNDGSWQAAIEYCKQKFAGFDVEFLTKELNNAKAESEALLLKPTSVDPAATANSTAQTHGNETPAEGKKPSPLADAKEMLKEKE